MKGLRCLFLITVLSLLSACAFMVAGCSKEVYYTATFKNFDGAVLQTETCLFGTVPEYSGEAPEKPQDAQFSYNFIGWDKELSQITEDSVYVAQYGKTARTYSVTWKDDDGTVLKTQTLSYGTLPEYGSPIATTTDHQYEKTFSRWSPAVSSVECDVTYTASYDISMTFPAVHVCVDGEITDDYSSCTVTTVSDDARYCFSDAAGKIKIRGNGTARLPKKAYRIKFDKKQTMFGLNDGLYAKSWVLLAEYTDRTMLKNATAFYLAREIMEKDGYYVSDSMFVEVYLNGEYHGLYLLAEQQQVGEGRVGVEEASKKNPTINTGYFIEMDEYAASEDVYFSIAYKPLNFINSETTTTRLQTKYTVKSDIYTDGQLSFITRKVQNTWSVLYDAAYTDRSTEQKPYYTVNANGDMVEDATILSAREAAERVIDLKSLINTWILHEICENLDVGWSSFFISVDCGANGNGKLTFEAPWDFDWAFGQKNYIAHGFYSVAANGTPPNIYNPWLLVLCNESWFLNLAAKRWAELNEGGSIIESAIEMIDAYYVNGKAAFDRNFEVWDMLTYVHSTHTSPEYKAATTQKDAIAWLETFLRYRENFLNYALRVNKQ